MAPSLPLPPGRGFETGRGATLSFTAFWIRNVIVKDPNFEPFLFDYRPYAQRLQYVSTLFDATNPDLTAFAARKGKLIIVQPPADNAVGLPMVAEYYRSVVAKIGQTATDATLKWVVDNVAPADSVTGYEIGPAGLTVKRTLPACRYPA